MENSNYRQNDIDLRNGIIKLINEHYEKQDGEKMLSSLKLKILQRGNELDHTEISLTWKFNKKHDKQN